MKIMFMVSSMQGGGAERVAALLANAWVERGHEVRLVPTFSKHGECVYALDDKVTLTFLFDLVEGNSGRLGRLSALRALIRAEQPDVILSFLPHVNCAAVLAARGTGIPVVACERIYPPLFRDHLPLPYRILRRILYPFATALVGQTEPATEWLRARGGRALTATIPNPVVLPLPASDPVLDPDDLIPRDAKLLLWAGRIDEQKRPRLFIEAIARMHDLPPEWRVVMLGDGPLRAAMIDLIAKKGLSDRILMPGFAGNPGAWYARADLFVMTSRFEGFPNTLMEAMAHGVAPIAFDVLTGPAELGHRGERMLLLPDDDQLRRLAEAIQALVNDADGRKTLATNAAKTASTYSVDTVLEQWNDLFETVISRRQTRGARNSS